MPINDPGFHDVAFPVPVARGARVTTVRKTEIITLGSGREERNARWRHAKRTYDAGGGVRALDDLFLIQSFFEARMGQLHAFRFRDPLDHASCAPGDTPDAADQVLGIGDGATDTFQLITTKGTTERPIHLPVDGTVTVAIDGIVLEPGPFSVSLLGGEVTFASGAIPPPGATVTAGFLFDTPARFASDSLDIDLTAFKAGAVPTIPLIEVFPKEAADA